MKPLLIGQAPGPRSDPAEPLSGRCGARLADLCSLAPAEFFASFRRVNLIDWFPGKAGKGDNFKIDAARRGAIELLIHGEMTGGRVVLLGNHVARTFGFTGKVRQLVWHEPPALPFALAFCPHPSGVNHWWNDPGNVRRARRFWRALARESKPQEGAA